MEDVVSVNSLTWCWVIETLARSQQVGAALLYELIAKAPPLLHKSSKQAREAVALRCLEEFFCPSAESIDDHPASHKSKAGFGASDSCEDVLQRVLRESSGSDIQKDASDDLKRDVRAFIKLKKASLPRCTLEVLKSMIKEGNHPSLKELGERMLRNETIPSNRFDSASTLPTVDENCNGGEPVLAEENGNSAENGTSDQVEKASSPNGNASHSKKGASSDQVQEGYDNTDTVDIHEPPVKKLKLDKQGGLQSQCQPSIPCDGNDLTNAVEVAQNHQWPNASRCHNGTSDGRSLGDRRKTDVHSSNQLQTSRDNDGLHPRETDIASKMLAFFSSQRFLPDDSPVMTETEVIVCMKCNKGGELLICCGNSCPLAFHENCLGCSASFDEQGKFYCPFCGYSRAISEYARAKEKVSLAKKELSLFIGGKNNCQAEPDSTTAGADNVNGQRQNEGINKTSELKNSDNVISKVANRCQLRSSKNKQEGVSASPANVAENAFVATAQSISLLDKQGAEIMVQPAGDTIRILNEGQEHDTDGGNALRGRENIADTSQEISKVKRKKEASRHHAAELCEDVESESISSSDGLSEDEKNNAKTSILSPTPLREVSVSNQSRRKEVPWTAEEEAKLKEGVQKFTQGDNRVIPWIEILEFGGSVFKKGRTPVDLKDKWRNIIQ